MEQVIPQGDVITVEDRLDEQCVRHVHLMSNAPFDPCGEGRVECEGGVYHYRANTPYRGVIDIPAACRDEKFRRLVLWSLDGYPSMRQAFMDAADEFLRLFHGVAIYGFVKKLPKGVEHGQELGDLTLLEADWMLERCVAVGCKH